MRNRYFPIRPRLRKWLRLQVFHRVQAIEDLTQDAIVFALHAGDEILGCGGTILRKRQSGAHVTVIHLTGDSSSLDSIYTSPDELSARIVGTITELQPQEIFLPHHVDIANANDTQRAIAQTLVDAVKSTKHANVYEVPVSYYASWPFVPMRQQGTLERATIWRQSLRTLFGYHFEHAFTHGVDIRGEWAQKKAAYAAAALNIAEGDFLDCFFQDCEVFEKWKTHHNRT